MKKLLAALTLVGLVGLSVAPVSAASCPITNPGAGSVNHCTVTKNSTKTVTNKTNVNVTNSSVQTGNGTNTNTFTFTFNGVPVTSSFTSCTVTTTVNGVTTSQNC